MRLFVLVLIFILIYNDLFSRLTFISIMTVFSLNFSVQLHDTDKLLLEDEKTEGAKNRERAEAHALQVCLKRITVSRKAHDFLVLRATSLSHLCIRYYLRSVSVSIAFMCNFVCALVWNICCTYFIELIYEVFVAVSNHLTPTFCI